MSHLLVTNDFPPKVGGIQSYLWELWRRLPPDSFTVLTTPYPGAAAFDAEQPFRIVRTKERVLMPTRSLRRRIDALASELDVDLVILDPALPLGLLGRSLELPYGVVLHGAEVTVPGRLPGTRGLLARVLLGADLVIAAGSYPAREAERAARRTLPTVIVPPGVDAGRFQPLDSDQKRAVRAELGLPVDGPLVVSVSRLVTRKGIDVLIDAAARLKIRRPEITVAVAGRGRDRRRLEWLNRRAGSPVHFLGRVPNAMIADVYGCGDVFVMLCRNRWRGLEQEGFGIVFLEAAAAGVPQVAGDSGGASDAVTDGVTGVLMRRPGDAEAVARTIEQLLDHPEQREKLAQAGRERACREFSYDVLAARLAAALT